MTTYSAKTCQACGRTFQTVEAFLEGTSRWRMCEKGHLWFNCQCHSTNVILKGKFDWYDPAHSLSSDAKSIFNQLSNTNLLPHIPSSVMEMQQLIQDKNVTSKQLADAAKKEPIIASNIFRIANNLKASTGTKITALEHAIAYIGLTMIHDIVLMAGIQSFNLPTKIFSSEHFWDNALLTGKIAEGLLTIFKDPLPPDEVYLGATLCNLGKIVGAFFYPALTDRVERDCLELKTMSNWQTAEKFHRLPSHTILGEIGSSMWGLPETINDASRFHHSIIPNHPGHRNATDYILFANQLTHWVNLEPNRVDQTLLRYAHQRFNLDEKETDKLAESFLPLRRLLA